MTLPFDKRLKNLPQFVWEKLNQIDELKGRWIGGANLNPQALGRLTRSVLVTSTGASTRIEGAQLSDEDVERLMRGLQMQTFANRDKQEVQGYYELLQNVFESWQNVPFTESTIQHFHQELLRYVEKDERHRGKYKKEENKVYMVDDEGKPVSILFDTTPAYLTPKEMQEAVEWVNDALKRELFHPLLIIGNFLVEFLNIHPFSDGNGRLSRVLTNLLMLKAGYPYVPYISHEKQIENNKAEYYVALGKSQKTIKTANEDITPWLNFWLEIVLEQSKQAIDLLSHENIEQLLSPKQLAVWQYLGIVDEASPREISEEAGVARPTVSQALDVLLRLKKIKRLGQGRSTRYTKL